MTSHTMVGLWAAGRRHGHHSESMTSLSQIQLWQSMHIYLKNNPAKFHPNPIWNNGALAFYWRVSPLPQQEQAGHWRGISSRSINCIHHQQTLTQSNTNWQLRGYGYYFWCSLYCFYSLTLIVLFAFIYFISFSHRLPCFNKHQLSWVEGYECLVIKIGV